METKPEAPIAKSEMSSTEAAVIFACDSPQCRTFCHGRETRINKKKVISFSSKGVMWKILLSSAE